MFVLLNHMSNNMTQKEDLQKNERSCNDYFRIQGLFFFVCFNIGSNYLSFLTYILVRMSVLHSIWLIPIQKKFFVSHMTKCNNKKMVKNKFI